MKVLLALSFVYVTISLVMSLFLSFDSSVRCNGDYKVFEVVFFQRVLVCEGFKPFGNWLISPIKD